MDLLKPVSNHFGLHYFPDTFHFRDLDLQTWLPEILGMGATWITLVSPVERAIPEEFIQGLVSAGIEPVLHLPMKIDRHFDEKVLSLLFHQYARWGVRYIALFDQPNNRQSWQVSEWTQSNLVERFLDIYLPLAARMLEAGLTPVLPPLKPGGDFWDTTFLRATLRGIHRRGHDSILNNFVLGAYGFTNGQPLNWGSGGPERWSEVRPYMAPSSGQDHIGFHIYEWYSSIAKAELGFELPVILLRAGSRITDFPLMDPGETSILHAQRNLTLIRLVKDLSIPQNHRPSLTDLNPDLYSSGEFEQLKPTLLAANFWLMAADKNSPSAKDAWYRTNGDNLPITNALKYLAMQECQNSYPSKPDNQCDEDSITPPVSLPEIQEDAQSHPISHYLLLPLYAWGFSESILEPLRPILQQYQPTIGFSIDEALLAERVTVVGDQRAFSPEKLQILKNAGCIIERVSLDGTILAL